jgi:hypothetical protein
MSVTAHAAKTMAPFLHQSHHGELDNRLGYRLLEMRLSEVERQATKKRERQKRELREVADMCTASNFWKPSAYRSGPMKLV